MLTAAEFSVGAFANAVPLSLILPRNPYEQTALIGTVNGAPTAVFLTGQFAHECFECAGTDNWHGLLVPNVNIEVDETSVFDPSQGMQLGAVIRRDTRLVIQANRERSTGARTSVVLHDGLAACGDFKAGFRNWRVVIGEGATRRVLWSAPDKQP